MSPHDIKQVDPKTLPIEGNKLEAFVDHAPKKRLVEPCLLQPFLVRLVANVLACPTSGRGREVLKPGRRRDISGSMFFTRSHFLKQLVCPSCFLTYCLHQIK